MRLNWGPLPAQIRGRGSSSWHKRKSIENAAFARKPRSKNQAETDRLRAAYRLGGGGSGGCGAQPIEDHCGVDGLGENIELIAIANGIDEKL
jgi:hypothetical protein